MDELIPTITSDNQPGDIERVAEETLATIAPPETESFRLSFADYKVDKCSIDGMSPANAQRAIKIIRDVGVDFKSYDNFSSKHAGSKLEIKPISNIAPYDEYYKKLPLEIQEGEEVKEIKYVDNKKEVNLRIFFYTLTNVFFMLAITANKHENLDHKPYKEQRHKRRG